MEILQSWLVVPFTYAFMVRALTVSVLVGIMCPLLGTYVVTRDLGFMSDALAHAVMPGVVAAVLAGLHPLWGSVPMAAAVALLLGWLVRRTGLSADTTIGILFAGLFALGVMVMSMVRHVRINLEDLLLGQVLGASRMDVAMTALLTVAVAAILYGLHSRLLFVSFDPLGAKVAGLSAERLDYVFLVLLAVVIVTALQAVGIILVVSLLITPAAAALLVARRVEGAMALGAGFGVAAAVVGLYASYHLNVASGPAMALVATAIFAVAFAVAAARR